MKINKNRQQSGITLIALVITIIVMLILVAVTINMAVNGRLFDYAGKAVGDTQNAINAEQELANLESDLTVDELIDKYTNGKTGGTGGSGNTLPTYAEAEFDETTGMLKENATYTSGIYTAVIPKGFAIVPGLNGTTTIADGLVITDEVDENGNSIGNEFVWIPVTVTESDSETSIASFYRSDWKADDENGGKRGTTLSSSYTEPYASGYANETTEMVVKRDAYPYNYVGWGLEMDDYTSNVTNNSLDQGLGALALSKALYANKDVGVTSTLCYGIQWDAMLDFIKDKNHNVKTSTTWGNYKNNAWTITRTSAKYSDDAGATWTSIPTGGKSKTSTESILLTTGASDDFAAKNIFDVAGNVFERTNEAVSSTLRVSRGGNFGNNGSDYPASYRSSGSPYYCYSSTGFRAVLYIS